MRSLEFNPTEFSAIRTRFTHDRSDRDGRVNNEGLLQFTFTIGLTPSILDFHLLSQLYRLNRYRSIIPLRYDEACTIS